MIAIKDKTTLPATLEEFVQWEPNDGFNGAARAVQVE
jgi:hypothetical protein